MAGFSAELAQGDSGAWSLFYREQARRLWMWLHRRLGDRHAADDLLSQTFMAALAGRGAYDPSQPADAWLYGIARRKLADYLRQHYRQRRQQERLATLALTPESEEQIDLDRRARAVEEALAAMPANQRDVLVWMYFDRLSMQQIAARLHRSPKAVENLLYRARQKFREVYHDPEMDLSPTTQNEAFP